MRQAEVSRTRPLRDALHIIDQHIDDYIDRARPGKAA
jgi:hypothetical protein